MEKSLNSNNSPTIIWFRQDLRLNEQPAFTAAIQSQSPIIPLYIWCPEEEGKWPMGAASKWWLHHSLESLKKDLSQQGLKLIIKQGSAFKVLKEIISLTGATTLFCNRCYEPAVMQRDALLQSALEQENFKMTLFNGSLLYDPWTILNKKNRAFQVFTFFWKACLKTGEPSLSEQTHKTPCAYTKKIDSCSIESLELLPKIHWDKGLCEAWKPGEKNALDVLKQGICSAIPHYTKGRDFPGSEGTSQLSPYLHFGEISPHTVWNAIKAEKNLDSMQAEAFLRQLGWRDFAYYLLYHFPFTTDEPLREQFAHFAWKDNLTYLHAWQKGLTGYPIIDAGMRQLWKTGWMHNRVRMLVGSFLVKDLLISWQEGAKWFWDTLVDADLANNSLGWQWIGGCGADAAPYFRIFNPIVQGEKFDAMGEYVKKWVPELKLLPKKWMHCPWKAPTSILREAGVELGITYPKPIVDHDQARLDALKNFARLKEET